MNFESYMRRDGFHPSSDEEMAAYDQFATCDCDNVITTGPETQIMLEGSTCTRQSETATLYLNWKWQRPLL